MQTIPLTHGQVALVDEDVYEGLMIYKWSAIYIKTSATWYAVYDRHTVNVPKNLYMHRLIMGAVARQLVDHVDHNGLNNLKSNLRLCTRAENQANQRLSATNKSGYKGVSLDQVRGGWVAVLGVNYKRLIIGHFDNPLDAGAAYDSAAIHYFGEFALTNKALGLL